MSKKKIIPSALSLWRMFLLLVLLALALQLRYTETAWLIVSSEAKYRSLTTEILQCTKLSIRMAELSSRWMNPSTLVGV